MQTQDRVSVLGASGLMGKVITEALLNSGKFAVTAIMRNPSGLGITHESLRVAKADVLSQDQLEEALDGSTAAVVAIGRDLQSDQDTLTESAIVITKALQSKGIKRLIMIGGTGIISIGDGKHVLDTPHYPVIYQKVGRDLLGAYKVYAAGQFEFTAACPPEVKDLPFTGKYAVAADKLVEPNLFVIGNREVADFVLKELVNPQFVGSRVNLTATE